MSGYFAQCVESYVIAPHPLITFHIYVRYGADADNMICE